MDKTSKYSRAIELLEFRKVLEIVSGYTNTIPGKELILNSGPLSEEKEIVKNGNYVSEAKNLLIDFDLPPFEYLTDLNTSLSQSTIDGSVLNTDQIKDVLKLSQISRKLFQYLKNNASGSILTQHFASGLFIDKVFEHHISSVFDEAGEIKDNASDKLKQIRKEIIEKSERLRKSVNKILKRLSESYLVQEEYVTLRDGRIVLPIKAEHKRHVKGFVHSESASGQTVYIEPEETLELNNEILSLTFAEKREIERILRNLTGIIGKNSQALKHSLYIIAELDSIFAKAQYSLEMIGSFPTIDRTKPLHIIDARHPLLIRKLKREKTVPLNIKIENQKVILITGPNAGGKTVVLKTLGLLQLMLLSGFHIPVDPDSNFWIFDQILLDIGDQQSIEDDLSTFSSHLININAIIHSADKNSLVLMDEIGTGTDPTEGAALATAVLTNLRDKEAVTFATTHHGSLKIIANNLDGFENASMIFDSVKLIPTYIFSQGLPGSSYAFEVAERIGLDKKIINTARENVDSDKNRVEDLLIDLEKKSNELKEKLNYFERENTRLQGLTQLYSKQVEKLEKEKKEIISKTRSEADIYLKDINKKVENAIQKIRESNADKAIVKEERAKLQDIKKINEENIAKNEEEEIDSNGKIDVGSYVQIRDSETKGKVLDIDGNKAVISSGSVKISVKMNKLIKIKKKDVERPSQYSPSYSSEYLASRLDIRGKRPEEVEFELTRYIDDAYTNNVRTVEIIHGKGTGALKKTVRELLEKHEAVKGFEYAKIEMGGEGVTIVELN